MWSVHGAQRAQPVATSRRCPRSLSGRKRLEPFRSGNPVAEVEFRGLGSPQDSMSRAFGGADPSRHKRVS